MTIARFVHGTAAGNEMEVNGLYHRVAKLQSLDDIFLDVDPLDTIDMSEVVEDYEIHQFRFRSGHVHNYAAPVGVSQVGLFNEMWHGYRSADTLRCQLKEVESQNSRLRQELWRERFKNQFGKYPEER